MLISKNKRFRQEINADQRHWSFSAHFKPCFRPHQTNTLVLEEKMKTTLTDSFQRKQASQRRQICMKSLVLDLFFKRTNENNITHLHPIFYEGLLSFHLHVCMLQVHVHCSTNTKYGRRHSDFS